MSGGWLFAKIAPLKGRLPVPVLLYFLTVILPIGFSLGSVYMTGVRLLLILTTVPLTIQLLMGRYGRVLPTDILFLLHFFWIIVALAFNNPDLVVQNAGATGIEFIGGYALARAFIRNREDFAALIRLLATIICCLLPFVLYEATTGNAIILNTLRKLPGVYSLNDIEIGKRLGVFRAQVSFTHPIHWGLFCAVCLPMCYVGLQGIYGNARRILVACIIGISGLIALSSGALLAIILQLGLFAWAGMFRKTDKRWIILLVLGAFCYVIIDILSNRSPLMVFLSYATFSSHTAYWRTLIFDWGMVNVWANPIFGIGLNDWVRPSWMHSGSMDNFWLVMAVRYGIPGFTFIATGYLIALWKIGRRKLDTDPTLWQFRRAWMFSFVGLTFTLCTVHVWSTVYSFVFFMFGAGMWMLTDTPKGNSTTAPSNDDKGNAARQGMQRRLEAQKNRYARAALANPTDTKAATVEKVDHQKYTRFPVRRS